MNEELASRLGAGRAAKLSQLQEQLFWAVLSVAFLVVLLLEGGVAEAFAPMSYVRVSNKASTSSSLLVVSDHFSSLVTDSSSVTAVPALNEQIRELNKSYNAQILSKDPLVYVIPNLLSPEECEQFQSYVQEQIDRPMTRSNPPEVSLDASKLWPLPFLSILSGLPPYLRLMEQQQSANNNLAVSDILHAVLPDIGISIFAMASLAWLVVLPLIRAISNESSRTSVATALNTEADMDFVRPLIDKVFQASGGHAWQNWEAPVVTRYEPGAIFARHNDASPTYGSEWKELGGQRVVTCICYLNSLGENCGGQTYFDKLDIAVQPQQGSALFFFPADATTWKADDRTTHESLPTGENCDKWIVQLFGRAQRVPPPLGLPDTFDRAENSAGDLHTKE